MPRNKNDYDPFDDSLPRVQIPLGADRAGLSVDGEFMALYELPEAAREAYLKYADQGGNVRIYQCDRCGYLTDSDAFSVTTYNRAYECGGCGARLSGTTQHGSNESVTQVHGPMLDDERRVDIPSLVTDEQCDAGHGPIVVEEPRRYGTAEIDEAARDCPHCVPNHPSHLGRLRNAVEGEITQSEMMQRVAEAVKEFREG